ncbi:MAG: DUF1819 domain-containing protein [Polyangiaceae bacterium]
MSAHSTETAVSPSIGEPRLGRPAESTEVHTRILRCMLATDDCFAYWRHADPSVPQPQRARLAFEQRWFGTKTEARVRTIMTDMVQRFDAYPESLALFQHLGRIPVGLRTFLCHLHTQLADPVYRSFAGDFLPGRRGEGRTTVDRADVVRWVEASHPGRWSPITCAKFASNLLATALDVELVRGRRDPRALPPLAVPELVVGYALYLLRTVRVEGSLTENPYLRSLGVDTASLARVAPRVPGIRFVELAGAAEVTFLEPSLTAWGVRYFGGLA